MAEESKSYGLAWFLAGLGVGALVGILYAPKSGRETREDIASGASEGTEYLRARTRQAAEEVSAIVDKGKEQVTRVRRARQRGRGSRPRPVGRVCGAGQEPGLRTDRPGLFGCGCRTPGLPLDHQLSRHPRVLRLEAAKAGSLLQAGPMRGRVLPS